MFNKIPPKNKIPPLIKGTFGDLKNLVNKIPPLLRENFWKVDPFPLLWDSLHDSNPELWIRGIRCEYSPVQKDFRFRRGEFTENLPSKHLILITSQTLSPANYGVKSFLVYITVVVTLLAPPFTTQKKSWTPPLSNPFGQMGGVGPLLVWGRGGQVMWPLR